MQSLNSVQFFFPYSNIKTELTCFDEKDNAGEAHITYPYLRSALKSVNTESGTPPMGYLQDESGITNFFVRENTEYTYDFTVPGDHQTIHAEIAKNPAFPFLHQEVTGSYKRAKEKYWRSSVNNQGKSFVTIPGRLHFKSRVGLVDLSISENETLILDVASAKIDHFGDFTQLIEDIASETVELLFQIGTSTGLRFSSSSDLSVSEQTVFFLLRSIFSDLSLSIETIINEPHRQLLTETELKPLALVKSPDISSIVNRAAELNFIEGGSLSALFSGFTPIELFDTDKFETYDTPENRFVKDFLNRVLQISLQLKSKIESRLKNENKKLSSVFWTSSLSVIKQWIEILEEFLSYSLWNQVSNLSYVPSNSQVLQKKEGYRNILHMANRLELGLNLNWSPSEWDSVHGDMRTIHELYEIWCYFQLRKAIFNSFAVEKAVDDDVWTTDKDILRINLKRGKQSKSTFLALYKGKKLKVEIYYNKRFLPGLTNENSYSLTMQPDYTVNFIYNNSETMVHFDAKYRLENLTPDELNIVESDDDDSVTISKREDIIKMHAYVDSIRGSKGAYILYPGKQRRIFYLNEKFVLPSVGALPLRPNASLVNDDLVELQNFIKNIADFVVG